MIELLQRYAALAPEEIRLVPRGTHVMILWSPAIDPVVVNVAVGNPQESMVDIAVLGIVQWGLSRREDLSFTAKFHHHMMNRSEEWAKPFDFWITSDTDALVNFGNSGDLLGEVALTAYVAYLESLTND